MQILPWKCGGDRSESYQTYNLSKSSSRALLADDETILDQPFADVSFRCGIVEWCVGQAVAPVSEMKIRNFVECEILHDRDSNWRPQAPHESRRWWRSTIAVHERLFSLLAETFNEPSGENLHELDVQLQRLVEDVLSENLVRFQLVFFIRWQDGPRQHILSCICTIFCKGGWKNSKAGCWNNLKII